MRSTNYRKFPRGIEDGIRFPQRVLCFWRAQHV
jgi:hypothetical protein